MLSRRILATRCPSKVTMEILEILKLAEPKEGIVAKANPKFGEEKEVSGCAESREIAPFIQRILEFN